MSVTEIRWLPNEGYDIHLLHGQTSRRLDEMLVLELSDDTAVLATAPPSGVTVRFQPEFAGAPDKHGVTVDTSKGEVKVASSVPSGRPLHNFIIQAVVTDPTANKPIEPVFIRFHIHPKIKELRLTPRTLTLRPDAEGLRFTLLAEFEDGVLGDITDSRLPGLIWLSGSSKIEVNGETGELKVKDFVEGATISASLFGKTAEASVKVEIPWGTPRSVTFMGGKGKKKWKEATNILFLPEGFAPSENRLFERLVQGIVQDLRRRKATRPFDLLKNAINYWMAFEASGEAGATVLPECYTRALPDLAIRGAAIPSPVPPKASPATTAWSPLELIHKIGLPVSADAQRSLDDGANPLLPELQQLYGSDITKDRLQKFFTLWRDRLSFRVLVNEVDTAFGLAQGERPRVARVTREHWSQFHPRRTSLKFLFSTALDLENELDNRNVQKIREAFQSQNIELSPSTVIVGGETVVEKRWLVVDLKDNRTFSFRKEGPGALKVYERQTLQHLMQYLEKLGTGGETIGTTWTTTGKDRGLVCFITRVQHQGGVNQIGKYCSVSLGTEHEYPIVSATIITEGDSTQHFINPMAIPTKAAVVLVATVAHELAHSPQFGLGDEYSEFGKLRIPERRARRLQGNLQSEQDLLKDPNNAQSGLDGGKIKWSWVRIRVAAVLKAKPLPVGPVDPVTNTQREFEIDLREGQGKPFSVLNEQQVIAFLRRRPLVRHPALSSGLSLMKVEMDKITVRLFGGAPGIDPDEFPPGSVLLIPAQEKVEPPLIGRELSIVAPFIRDHITTSGRPLKSSRNAQDDCVYEVNQVKPMTPDNLPAGIKNPRDRAFIIGLYESGAFFSCGVYHASGVCLMRWNGEVPGASGGIYEFCHVCRYIMVDAVDPTQHASIEQDYKNNKRYPERVS